MPILYRQLSKELLALFFAILLILLTIILSFRLTNLLSAAATGDLPLRAVWQLLYLQSLRFLILLSPLSFILAATLTLGRLYRDHEISALLASGISQTHLLKALLLTALPLSFFLYLLNHHTLPHLYQQQDTLKQQANQQASLLLFTPNTFQQISDHLTIHASAQQQTQLQNILIAHTPPQPTAKPHLRPKRTHRPPHHPPTAPPQQRTTPQLAPPRAPRNHQPRPIPTRPTHPPHPTNHPQRPPAQPRKPPTQPKPRASKRTPKTPQPRPCPSHLHPRPPSPLPKQTAPKPLP